MPGERLRCAAGPRNLLLRMHASNKPQDPRLAGLELPALRTLTEYEQNAEEGACLTRLFSETNPANTPPRSGPAAVHL
mgnify:CR=1 FL=1